MGGCIDTCSFLAKDQPPWRGRRNPIPSGLVLRACLSQESELHGDEGVSYKQMKNGRSV